MNWTKFLTKLTFGFFSVSHLERTQLTAAYDKEKHKNKAENGKCEMSNKSVPINYRGVLTGFGLLWVLLWWAHIVVVCVPISLQSLIEAMARAPSGSKPTFSLTCFEQRNIEEEHLYIQANVKKQSD